MKKILVISWFYPPINSSEGLLTYKLLSNSSLEYIVFTQKNCDLWAYQKNDYLPENSNVKIIYSSANTFDNWETDAINYYRKNQNKFDIVMTRSMPESSHKIGLAIKKINPKIKWIASFGDPIANNPFIIKAMQENPYTITQRYIRPMGIKEIVSPKRCVKSLLWGYRKNKGLKKILRKNKVLETNIIKTADKILCNNLYQAKYMLKNEELMKKKLILILHNFDKKLYPKYEKKNKKIKFVYIGHLDSIRTPKLLFEAIILLKNKCPEMKDRVIFEFYGNMDLYDKIEIINEELTDIVKVYKGIDYFKSLEIMQESDWLIHFDANLSNIIEDNIFFAGKLADYFGTNANIMGITMLEGASADILRKMNALVISHSVDEIYNYLYLIIFQNYRCEINNKEKLLYSSKNVAKKFDNEINSILKNKGD